VFINHYKSLLKINKNELNAEMIVAKNCIKKDNWQFEDLLPILKDSEHIFPNLYKMMKVVLILPVSTVTCERSFNHCNEKN